MAFRFLKKEDPLLYQMVKSEIERQKNTIDLIPSENFVSPAILEVLGSPLTNKYSEGYPGKRYYPGNEFYDKIEKLAQQRALKVFSLKKNWQVNVQPYSGSPANLAVYNALLKPGEILMGMSLSSGGHLTHGHSVNFSGKIYKAIPYHLNPKTELIDFNEVEKLAKKHRPKIIVCGLTAYSKKIDFKKFSVIAKKTGAYLLADISHISGLIAANLHPSPFPYCDIVTTTIHKTLKGPRSAAIFTNQSSSLAKKNNINLSELIDKSVFPGLQGGPHNNVIAAAACAFKEALQPKFKKYQKQVLENASFLAKDLIGYGFRIVSGGTENHLMVIDLRNTFVSGREAEKLLEKAGLLANRNTVPGDPSPFNPSGIRIGTPACTTRGMGKKEMNLIALWINKIIKEKVNPEEIKKEVRLLCQKFPIYPSLF